MVTPEPINIPEIDVPVTLTHVDENDICADPECPCRTGVQIIED